MAGRQIRRKIVLRADYQHQINVDNAIVSLSTYVGHVRVTDIYWYVSTVPELMASVSQRFERYAREISND